MIKSRGKCVGQKVAESPILPNFLVTIYWVTTTSKLCNIEVSSKTQYEINIMMCIVLQKKTRAEPIQEKRVFAQGERELSTP